MLVGGSKWWASVHHNVFLSSPISVTFGALSNLQHIPQFLQIVDAGRLGMPKPSALACEVGFLSQESEMRFVVGSHKNDVLQFHIGREETWIGVDFVKTLAGAPADPEFFPFL